jgi:hypothetical protein
MGESGRRDLYVLARVALGGRDGSEDDINELLTARRKRRRRMKHRLSHRLDVLWIASRTEARHRVMSEKGHKRKSAGYSITSSALPIRPGAMVNPNALAAFMFMIKSKCVGCCTGKSLGFAPRKILST